MPEFISESKPAATADLVLCSHVFYFVELEKWMETLETLISWLNPQGVAVLVLLNPTTDIGRMWDHFLGRRFDIAPLGDEFQRKHEADFVVKSDTVPARFTPLEARSAYTVMEFFLNDFPMVEPIRWKDVEQYVKRHFGDPAGYPFSCDQDCLQIQRRR